MQESENQLQSQRTKSREMLQKKEDDIRKLKHKHTEMLADFNRRLDELSARRISIDNAAVAEVQSMLDAALQSKTEVEVGRLNVLLPADPFSRLY